MRNGLNISEVKNDDQVEEYIDKREKIRKDI